MNTLVSSSFPHFLSSCIDSLRRLKFPQDYHTNECDFHDKCLVSTFTGQYGPLSTLFPFSCLSGLRSGPRQRATCSSSTIRLKLFLHWLFFILFSHTLILIRSDRDDILWARQIAMVTFSFFSFLQKLSISFIFDTYNDFHTSLTHFLHLCLPRLL